MSVLKLSKATKDFLLKTSISEEEFNQLLPKVVLDLKRRGIGVDEGLALIEKVAQKEWLEGELYDYICDELHQTSENKKQAPPVERWVVDKIKELDINYSYAYESMKTVKGEIYRSDEFIRRLFLDANAARYFFSVQAIEFAVEEWKRHEKIKVLVRLRERVQYDCQYTDKEIKKLLKAVTGKEVDKKDLAVIKQWIWTGKRKLFGLPVKYHIMPVIVGKQGSGKTTFITRLLNPVKDISSLALSFEAFSDERQTPIMNKNYFGFLDELAKANSVAVELIKKGITSETVEWREMRQTGRVVALNNMTFIGASNISVAEVFLDQTGNRRFWEIITQDKITDNDLKDVNYLGIWQCVNENDDRPPILDCLNEIEAHQKEHLRPKSSIEQWIDYNCEKGDLKDKDRRTGAKDLYLSYKSFMNLQNNRAIFTMVKFYKALKDLGYDSIKSGGMFYDIVILKDDEGA